MEQNNLVTELTPRERKFFNATDLYDHLRRGMGKSWYYAIEPVYQAMISAADMEDYELAHSLKLFINETLDHD